MQLHNTLTKKLEAFTPLKKGHAGLYTCGPTVYNFAHIGNLRTYIFEDVLKRVLLYNGYAVKHIMNITDVGHLTSDADSGEDKMEKGAQREGATAWDIADRYTAAFFIDLKHLNILPADKFPRATEHIKEQIGLIKKLEKKGFTYRTVDGIYFDTVKLPDYGKLANLQNQELRGGVRVDVGDKKNITDFALWKFSPPLAQRQMEWKSPWGVGFPGWHIECSAMAVKYLGQPFDIHCGGVDHIPVHHTNEIAQSEAAEGKPLSNYWLHGEFLLMGADKMAKSGDNFITLETIVQHGISPIAYRFFLLQTHYRKQLNFSWEALEAAQTGLERLYAAARGLMVPPPYEGGVAEGRGGRYEGGAAAAVGGGLSHNAPKADAAIPSLQEKFKTHLNTDLDLPAALALVWTALKEKTIDLKTLLEFDAVLGLRIEEHLTVETEIIPANIQKLVTERDAARAKKDWPASDVLRKQLEDAGYEVKDTKDGTKVIKK